MTRLLIALTACGASLAAVAQPAAPAAPTAYRGLGIESVTPAQLAQFRPPPLPEALSRKLQALLDVRAPGLTVPSPDGRQLFFNWSITGTVQVWRLDGPGLFPQQLTGGEDKSSVEGISPDGRWLAIERDRKGEENPGLYLQPATGGPLLAVQHAPKVQTEFQGFSDDGRALYYVANDQKPGDYAVYRWDIAAGRAERLLAEPGYWRIGDHKPGKLLLVKRPSSQYTEWYELDIASRQLTPVLGQDAAKRDRYVLAYGAQPGEYIVRTELRDGRARTYRWARAQGDAGFTPIGTESRWDDERFVLDRAGRTLWIQRNEAGYSRTTAYDARTLQPIAVPWPQGLDHQVVAAVSPDGRHASLRASPPGAPARNLRWDAQARTLTPWFEPSVPEVDAAAFVPAVLESYPARDGTPIPVFVRRPPQCATSATPCPVIVHFHGGPEAQTKPGFSPVWQFFVDAGFVVAEPNVRGSAGYGRAWLDADNGPKRLDVITDVEDAALYIRKAWAKNGVAPKVGVYGGSYGGYATLYAMTRFAGAYDAGVSNVGMANLLSFLENTAPYRRALRTSEYGDPVADRAALVELSPTTHIAKLKAPLMVIQGVNDPRVPVGEALQMHEAAKARGVPNELLLFADSGHGASGRADQVLQWGHTLRFFQQHLQPAAR